MIEMYKMVSGACFDQVMPASASKIEERGNTARGHRYKLPRNYNQTRLRQHYVMERLVGPWNSLPDKAVGIPGIQKRSDKHWRDKDSRYVIMRQLWKGVTKAIMNVAMSNSPR